MSFILEYRRLFSIAVQEQGSGTSLNGFAIRPTPATRERLVNQQLAFRATGSACEVFYRLNPLAPEPLMGRITSRVRLSFTLHLSRADFFKLYEPDLTAATGPQFYFDNLTPSGDIQANTEVTLSQDDVAADTDAVQVVPRRSSITADVSGDTPPTQYTVRRKFEPADFVLQVPIQAVSGGRQVVTEIDLSSHPSGPYTIETDTAAADRKTLYFDDDSASIRALGLIDVHWDQPQDTAPSEGVPYVIRFRKR